MQYTVTLIPGDGIGPEVTEATQEVIAAAGVQVQWERYDAAFSSILAHEQIINKKGYLPGKQVVQHFANVVVSAFHRAPEPLAARESAAGPQSLTST